MIMSIPTILHQSEFIKLCTIKYDWIDLFLSPYTLSFVPDLCSSFFDLTLKSQLLYLFHHKDIKGLYSNTKDVCLQSKPTTNYRKE